jgi:hypothetical protein
MANFGNQYDLIPAGTVITAAGNTAGKEFDDRNDFRGQLTVSAVSGTSPSLTVNVQTSYDNGVTDPWRTLGSFPAQTAAGSTAHQSFPGCDRWIRASWTVAGTTPSFTVGVTGDLV